MMDNPFNEAFENICEGKDPEQQWKEVLAAEPHVIGPDDKAGHGARLSYWSEWKRKLDDRYWEQDAIRETAAMDGLAEVIARARSP